MCNVYHMFYDKSRVSTQISRLCHVHAQVHTLKDMSRTKRSGDQSEHSMLSRDLSPASLKKPRHDLDVEAAPHVRDRVSLTLTLTLTLGVGVMVGVGVGVGLRLVNFVLEHEVFLGRRGLDRVTTYCVLIGLRFS